MASQKELLSVKGQDKMDKLKDATWDDMGGPELDWTTDKYMNFKFDATRGVKPDTTILSKAAVKAEKADTVKEAVEHDSEEEVMDLPLDKPMAEAEEAEDEKEEESADEALEAEEAPAKEDAPVEEAADEFSFDLKELMGDEDMNAVDLKMDDHEAAPVADVEEAESYDMDEAKEEDEESEAEESEEEGEEEGEESEEEGEEDEEEEVKKEAVQMSDDGMDEEAAPVAESRLVLSFKFDQADKLFENNSMLTEEDKRQGRVLFEAAIRDVAKQVGTKLNEAYSKKFEQAKALHEKKMVKHVDQYLNYVVEQWAKDNKVGLKSQIQTKLTENFMNGMKRLFEQHYIDIPESKVNVVEALAKNVKVLKQQVRASEEKAVQLHSEMKTAVARERQALVREHRARLIAEAAGALPVAERGQFAKRAESLTFSNTKNYKKDLVALREQYFGAKPSVEQPINVPDAAPMFEEKQAAPVQKSGVDIYAQALERFAR